MNICEVVSATVCVDRDVAEVTIFAGDQLWLYVPGPLTLPFNEAEEP